MKKTTPEAKQRILLVDLLVTPAAARAASPAARPSYRTNRYGTGYARSYGSCTHEDYPCCGCGG